MKKILYKNNSNLWIILLASLFIFSGCNKEWEGEQYEKYLSFVHSGTYAVYLKYESEGGKKRYKLPVQVSGSEMPTHDIHLTLTLDKDTIDGYNFETFRNRQDLFYKELEEKHYNFDSWSTTIPDGDCQGYLYVDFTLDGLDTYHNYFLPLQIDPSSDLPPNPRKYYKKCLMEIIPFNDFSGKYSVAGTLVEINDKGEIVSDPLSIDTRLSRVVDEKTIFFYAGMINEDALDRSDYMLYASFEYTSETEGVVILRSNNPAIDLKDDGCTFIVSEIMDSKQPYLKRKYVTVDMNYSYLDITNPAYPICYRYNGPMVMERVYNILMPEEDQIIW